MQYQYQFHTFFNTNRDSMSIKIFIEHGIGSKRDPKTQTDHRVGKREILSVCGAPFPRCPNKGNGEPQG